MLQKEKKATPQKKVVPSKPVASPAVKKAPAPAATPVDIGGGDDMQEDDEEEVEDDAEGQAAGTEDTQLDMDHLAKKSDVIHTLLLVSTCL